MPIASLPFLVISAVLFSAGQGVDGFATAGPRETKQHSARLQTRLFQDQPNSEGIVTQDAAKNQLFSAFNNLDLSDQYDAVLTGLCAKILDTEDTEQEVSLQDCSQLLAEMNQKTIDASPRSLMALVDVSG